MPIPNPKDKEKQNDYMGRCMEFMRDEKYPQKQKVAICLNTFRGPQKKAKGEIEIDFSEQIKNLHKKEVKIEEPPHTAVTAPVEQTKA